jgi:DNA-binding transcriptional LysR family regulator
LREVEQARAAVSDEGEARGRLVVSAPVSFGETFLVPRLPKLLERNPALEVELRLEDRVADLLGEAVDVAIRTGFGVPDSADVVAHPLCTFQRYIVASPGYLTRRGRPAAPTELLDHDCLVHLGAGGTCSAWRFLDAGEQRVFTLRGPFSATTPTALRELALADQGIAMLGDWMVEDDLRAGRLERLLTDHEVVPVAIWAIHRRELRGSPRVRALLDVLAPEPEPRVKKRRK